MVYRFDAGVLDLIKQSEGFRAKAYYCPAGVLTIGYGHTNAAGEPKVVKGMVVSEEDATRMLTRDLQKVAANVDRMVKVPLNQTQLTVLVSFVYNVGEGNFKRSTLLRKLNAGDYEAVPEQLMRWNKARNPKTGKLRPLRGLTKRRRLEGHHWQAASDTYPVEDSIAQAVVAADKPAIASTTNWAAGTAILTTLAGMSEDVQVAVGNFSSAFNVPPSFILGGVVVIAGAWIISERIKKDS